MSISRLGQCLFAVLRIISVRKTPLTQNEFLNSSFQEWVLKQLKGIVWTEYTQCISHSYITIVRAVKCRHSALGIREKKRAGNKTVQCVIGSVLKEAWAVPPPSRWLINNTTVITFTVWFEGPWPHGGLLQKCELKCRSALIVWSVSTQCKRSASCLPAHCRLHRGGSFWVGLECQHTRNIEKL